MVLIYRAVIYIHVLSAIMSIGPFFILFPIVKKLKTAAGAELEAYMDTFRSVVRLSKHSGHVLVGSGVILIAAGPWTWGTSWVVMTLIILFLSLFFLARAFTPKLRKFREEGTDKEKAAAQLNRTVWIYIILLSAMLWFMVVKPGLW
ncbi:hypothetical protein KZX50_17400 [Bacillus infantis]|uniref:hypothetical protein n=1 Tax=Bacillus infantis TaxID=324767 RepID=UPI002005154B|nr:hypothetical protein [Bacillus infantis]MCK6207217.1 hypothetical protein [Bacillus infantis]